MARLLLNSYLVPLKMTFGKEKEIMNGSGERDCASKQVHSSLANTAPREVDLSCIPSMDQSKVTALMRSSLDNMDAPKTFTLDILPASKLTPQSAPPSQQASLIVEPGGNRSGLYLIAKRILDATGALCLLVVLSPVLVMTWAVLMVTTKGRPFFCQERLGLCGKPFICLKFRSMITHAEKLQHLIENEQEGPVFKNRQDPRITRIGAFMRKTSLDEMPQLLNVLLGDMSLVGPRPPIASEVEEYEDWQRLRLCVKPGLTCFWQVKGRSEIPFEEWMHLDLKYVNHQNLWVDLTLLLRTPWVLLTGRGAC